MRLRGFDPCPCSVGQGSGVAVSCGVGCRHGSDQALLWLWHRLVATALIRPLAWEPPYAMRVAQENGKKRQKKDKKKMQLSVALILTVHTT